MLWEGTQEVTKRGNYARLLRMMSKVRMEECGFPEGSRSGNRDCKIPSSRRSTFRHVSPESDWSVVGPYRPF